MHPWVRGQQGNDWKGLWTQGRDRNSGIVAAEMGPRIKNAELQGAGASGCLGLTRRLSRGAPVTLEGRGREALSAKHLRDPPLLPAPQG